MEVREHRRRVMSAHLEVRQILAEIWGDTLGPLLIEAHYQGDGFTTAGNLAERGNLSDDTTRRELDKLVDRDCAEVEIRGRTRYYRARPDLAEQTTDQILNVWIALATDLLSFRS